MKRPWSSPGHTWNQHDGFFRKDLGSAVPVGVVRIGGLTTIRRRRAGGRPWDSGRRGETSRRRDGPWPVGGGDWGGLGLDGAGREAGGRRGRGADRARGVAEAVDLKAADRPRAHPHGRHPDGHQPGRPQVRRPGRSGETGRGRLGDRADARVEGDAGTDGRGGRPRGGRGATAGVRPLRRGPPPHGPGPRRLPHPSRGLVGRAGLARAGRTPLDPPRRRARPQRPPPHRGVRRSPGAARLAGTIAKGSA